MPDYQASLKKINNISLAIDWRIRSKNMSAENQRLLREMNVKLLQLEIEVEKLKSGGQETETALIDILETTYDRIVNPSPESVSRYDAMAQTAKGHPSASWKILSVIIISIGILLESPIAVGVGIGLFYHASTSTSIHRHVNDLKKGFNLFKEDNISSQIKESLAEKEMIENTSAYYNFPTF